jgi:hypothetical protein
MTKFGGAIQGAQRKSSTQRHQKHTIFTEKARKIELPNRPAAHARQQALVPWLA